MRAAAPPLQDFDRHGAERPQPDVAVGTATGASASHGNDGPSLDRDARGLAPVPRPSTADEVSGEVSLQRVIEAAPMAMAVFEAGGWRLLRMNRMAAEFFGRPAAHLVGRRLRDEGLEEIAALLGPSIDLAAESPPGVRRELQRPSLEGGAPRSWDTRLVCIDAGDGRRAAQVLMVASDVTDLRLAEQERFDLAIAQRGMLVQEVHHRIKNNLQGVAGLLQQAGTRFPEVAPVLGEAIGQLQAIAQVYGLQVGTSGPVPLLGLLQAVVQSVSRTFACEIRFEATGDTPQRWRLPEAEAIPVALTANELLTNAIKHGGGGEVVCRLNSGSSEIALDILNPGALKPGIDPAGVPAGASGLGLVRALLPRRAAELSLSQQGTQVLTRVLLRPPAVRREG